MFAINRVHGANCCLYAGKILINFSIASFRDKSDRPPEALVCPPPLKCALENSFTEKSPFDRSEILIRPLF